MKMETRLANSIAVLIAIAGFFVTGFIAERVYEHVPHVEDEFALLWQAEIMAEGDFYRPSPEHERSFLIPFVVDFDGRRFGKYPPGWPAALSLGARLDAPGWVNPVLAAACLWLSYRLARKMLTPALSLLAQLLLFSSPMFLMLSGNYMSHMYSLFLTLGFMLAWSDLFLKTEIRAKVPRWLLIFVAGGCIGLLFLTRPLTAVAVAFPFVVHALFLMVRRNRRVRTELLGISLIGAAIGALLFIWQWLLTGDVLTNPYTLWWHYDRIGFGPGIGVTESGHSLYWAFLNTRFSLRAGVHDLFGWPYLSWFLVPFGLFGLRKRCAARLLASVFVSLVLAYGFYWIGSWLFGPRYYFESITVLTILSAGGFGWLGGWMASPQAARRARRFISIGLLTMLMLANAIFYLPLRLGGMKGLYQIDRPSANQLIVEEPAHSLIIVKAERWFQYARFLYQVEPFGESPMLIAWSRGPQNDEELMQSYKDWDIYYFDAAVDESEEITS